MTASPTAEELIEEAWKRKDDRNWSDQYAGRRVDAETAIKHVTEVLTGQWLDAPTAHSTGTALLEGLLALDQFLSDGYQSEEIYVGLVEMSKTDYSAFQAVRALVALGTADYSNALKSWNALYVINAVMIPARPKGPSRVTNLMRDRLLIAQIRNVVALGFAAFRSQASDDSVSACDIVSQATHLMGRGRGMTYSALEAVWKRRDEGPPLKIIADIVASNPALHRKN